MNDLFVSNVSGNSQGVATSIEEMLSGNYGISYCLNCEHGVGFYCSKYLFMTHNVEGNVPLLGDIVAFF